MVVLNDLYDYGLSIYQDSKKFKFSLDSLLLSEFTQINHSDSKLLDLCSGNAPIPLVLAAKNPHLKITGVEIQPEVCNLANESIKYNKLESQITMLNINALDINNYFPGNNFDIITCNPPFFKVNPNTYLNKDDATAIARHELTITLEDIFKIVHRELKDNGRFFLVHRPQRLVEILNYATKYCLSPKIITFIHSKDTEAAIMVLIKFTHHGAIGTKVYNKVINRNCKTYQNIFNEY